MDRVSNPHGLFVIRLILHATVFESYLEMLIRWKELPQLEDIWLKNNPPDKDMDKDINMEDNESFVPWSNFLFGLNFGIFSIVSL